MSTQFWIKRFVLVFLGMMAVLLAVKLFRGSELEEAVRYSASWALIAATVFIGSRVRQSKKGQACALCNDTPDGNTPSGDKAS